MDPYQIICLLKGISVVRMEACATNIKVEVTIHEPYGDPLSVGRPRLTQRQLAAFALDFPHAIRDALRDVVSERDDLRDRLQELEIANRAGYVKVNADEVDGLMKDTESQAKPETQRKPATTPEELAARLQSIRRGGPRAGIKGGD